MSEEQLRIDALEYHEFPTPGKISIAPTKALANQRDLSLAYSPGVAYACTAIQENPDLAARYTARANLVAVIRQDVPAATKIFPIEFDRRQVPRLRQQAGTRVVQKDFTLCPHVPLLDCHLHALVTAAGANAPQRNPALSLAMLHPGRRIAEPPAGVIHPFKPAGDVQKRRVPLAARMPSRRSQCRDDQHGK
jgi:hypothetical protein